MNSSNLVFQSGEVSLILSSHLGKLPNLDEISQKTPNNFVVKLVNKKKYEKEIKFSAEKAEETYDLFFHRSGSRVLNVVHIGCISKDFEDLFLEYTEEVQVRNIEFCVSLHLNGSVTSRLSFSFEDSLDAKQVISLQDNTEEFSDELIKILDVILSRLGLKRSPQARGNPYFFIWIKNMAYKKDLSELLPLDDEKEKKFSKEILGLLMHKREWEKLPGDLIDRTWGNNRISMLGDPFFFLYSRSVFFRKEPCWYVPTLRKACELLISLEQGLMYGNNIAFDILRREVPRSIKGLDELLDEIMELRAITYISLDGLWTGTAKVEDLNILFEFGIEVFHLGSLRDIIVEKMRSLEFLYFAGYDRKMNRSIRNFSLLVVMLTIFLAFLMIIQIYLFRFTDNTSSHIPDCLFYQLRTITGQIL